MKPIIYLIVFSTLTSAAVAESESAPANIVVIGQTVAKSNPADLARVGADFEKEIKEADLAPSSTIRTEAKAVQEASMKLLANLGEGKFQKDSAETIAVSSAIKSTLNKLDSLIDESYKERPGVANVSPPPGTPNAAAGMDPRAISDPKLRKQYQDAIEQERAKQEKNTQQRELRSARKLILMHVAALGPWSQAAGLGREDLVELFSKEGKSRELLRKMVVPVAGR